MSTPLIVCGFHRSGTSMTMQALVRAGVFAGDRLAGAHPSNPDGHFEDLEVVELHDRCLRASNMDWCVAQKPELVDSEEFRVNTQRIASRLGAVQNLWGFKDPRATLFLQHWKNILPDSKVVGVYRHYAQCLDSLRRREACTLMHRPDSQYKSRRFWSNPEAGLRAWLIYNRHLIAHFQDQPKSVAIVSQSSIVNGLDIIGLVNQQFGFSMDNAVSSAVDKNKCRYKSTLSLPNISPDLLVELDAVWADLQAASLAACKIDIQVDWWETQTDNIEQRNERFQKLDNAWDLTGVPPTIGVCGDIKDDKKQISSEAEIWPQKSIDFSSAAELNKMMNDLQALPEKQCQLARAALEEQPDNPAVMSISGRVFLHAKQFDEADITLNKACALAPQNPGAWFHAGLSRFKQGDAIQARCHIKKALDIQPSPGWISIYADVLDSLGDSQEASDVLTKALQEYPDNTALLLRQIERLHKLKKIPEALALCDHIQDESRAGNIAFKKYQLFSELGDSANAAHWFDTFLKTDIVNNHEYRKQSLAILDTVKDQQSCNELVSKWLAEHQRVA